MEPFHRRTTTSLHEQVINIVRCPFCGYEAELDGFKLLKEPWEFSFYTVRMLECPRCRNVFSYYSGISPPVRSLSTLLKLNLGDRG